VVCLLTQVEVDADDPAFSSPSKPVGFFFEEREAEAVNEAFGWEMRKEGERGWRYVVPSPEPKHIVDISLIETVAKSGAVVIAGGGGGIPVVREPNGERHGLDAVIDKDLSSAHMASVLDAGLLMILTEVDAARLDFGKRTEKPLGEISVDELKRHHAADQFSKGSMGPKVQAAINFVEQGGTRAVIASLFDAEAALRGEAGTQILPAPQDAKQV
jgi:carbamate kinase